MIEMFKTCINLNTRHKMKELNLKYTNFKTIYEEYLNSERFINIISKLKSKYDNEYVQLFFRHSINFLDYYLKENDIDVKNEKNEETVSDEDI